LLKWFVLASTYPHKRKKSNTATELAKFLLKQPSVNFVASAATFLHLMRRKIHPIAQPKDPALLTAPEAAKHLRFHVKSLYRLAKAGKIPARKVGGQWRFHRQTLDDWLKTTGLETEAAEEAITTQSPKSKSTGSTG
jgi:excisionase family DNA binding protein